MTFQKLFSNLRHFLRYSIQVLKLFIQMTTSYLISFDLCIFENVFLNYHFFFKLSYVFLKKFLFICILVLFLCIFIQLLKCLYILTIQIQSELGIDLIS